MSDVKMQFLAICPCCHGAKYLELNDPNLEQTILLKCCHCDSKGVVPAEISPEE